MSGMQAWRAAVEGPLADPQTPFEAHWEAYQAAWQGSPAPHFAWEPSDATRGHANLTWLAQRANVGPEHLHAWTVEHREAFWSAMLGRLDIPFHQPPASILEGDPRDPVWLRDARLNVAQACWGDDDAPAIYCGREGSNDVETWTHCDLRRSANQISNGLLARYQHGDAIALYMPMNAICVAAYLAIVQAGLRVVSIPDSFAPEEVATRLRLGDAKAIVTVASFQRGGRAVPMAPKAEEAAAQVGAEVLVAGDDAWDAFLGDDAFDAVACHPQDVTNVLFSSGTTGEPKAIPWTHLTPIKAAVDGHLHQDIHPGDVVAWPTNIGWMMGPWLIYAALVNRATIALYEGVPTGEGFLEFLRRTRTTMLGVVPAIVRAWREKGVAKPHDLPDVRVLSSTGEASNAYDYLYLMSLTGYRAPVIEYCGGTEIGGAHITGSVLRPAAPAVFSTPAMGMDFVILEDGQHVAPGGHGQIFLIPPSLGLSQRLLNRDHHAEYYEGLPAGPEGQVLRRHGDEVHVIGNGYWSAGGRADDTMNLGGIKVSSIELEAAMNGAPVSETAAVAIPPEGGGADRLVVFAVATEPVEALKPLLQDRIKKRLNPLFRIHDVVLVDALPRTASNKVMRRELRAQY
ncbi:MAG: AMP-binding protein [Thermoplasmatota archaeon]